MMSLDRYHYGMVLFQKGKKKEAAAELTAALALRGDFPGAEEAKKALSSLKSPESKCRGQSGGDRKRAGTRKTPPFFCFPL